MKIVYIITLANLGGAQVHLKDLIYHLPKNIDPYIIIGEDGWLSDEMKKMKLKVCIVPTLVRQISPQNDIKAVFNIKKEIELIRPDIIHCHSSKAGIIGRVVAKMCNVPVVFTAHGWAFTDGISPWKKQLYAHIEKFIAYWTNKIICVSEYDKNIALNVMPKQDDKLITIHNGIPDRYFKKNDITKKDFRLVMIARFSKPKNQRLLIETVAKLIEYNISLRLTLVGDGPNFLAMKNLVNKLDIAKYVEFLGSRTDIAEILLYNDVFILISEWEGFPISIIEAMRQGLPVIASDVGGVSEAVIDNETGLLLPINNIAILKEKILKLYYDRKLAHLMGLKGREQYLNYFTSDKMMKQIIGVYEDVLRKG